jgi:hypothetical protein
MTTQNDRSRQKTNKYIFTALCLGIISVPVSFVVVSVFFSGPHYNRVQAEYLEQNVGKIKVGMTRQEIRKLFGKPHEYSRQSFFLYNDGELERARSWFYLYPDDDFSRQVDFDSTGKVIGSEKVNSSVTLW